MSDTYSDRLGITPLRFLDVALREWRNYLDLMVFTLLARGGPLSMDELVGALSPLWTGSPTSLRTSLQKAWAGREPIVKGVDGRLALNLESSKLNPVLVRLKLRPPPLRPPGPPEFVSPGPEVPLTIEELKACFWRGCPSNFSGVRTAAAVLDVVDRPMLPSEILGVIRGWTTEWLPEPEPSPNRSTVGLVVRAEGGRLALNRSATADLHVMRARVRVLALPRTRGAAHDVWYRERAEERVREQAARRAAMQVVPLDRKASSIPWRGIVVSVQPRIRMTRSFDQRSHTYLGYVLHVRGEMDDERRDFVVAVGPAAHEKHQFRVGDEVGGVGLHVDDPELETADLYKVSGVTVGERGPATRATSPPFTGIPPTLEEYRARGHRRLAALTYAAKCTPCICGCEMAVEMIIDQWNPSKLKYRRETFCYGPKSCPMYTSGPTRTVPGRKRISWTEEDWVDEAATAHRGPDE